MRRTRKRRGGETLTNSDFNLNLFLLIAFKSIPVYGLSAQAGRDQKASVIRTISRSISVSSRLV